MRGSKLGPRQLAARRLFFDGRHGLNRDALVLLSAFKAQGHVGGPLIVKDATGAIDMNATLAAAARREVWDYLKRLLNLDDYQETNIRDEDHT